MNMEKYSDHYIILVLWDLLTIRNHDWGLFSERREAFVTYEINT